MSLSEAIRALPLSKPLSTSSRWMVSVPAEGIRDAAAQLAAQHEAELSAILPPTFYADLPLIDRIKFMVRGWQKAVEASNQHYEAEAQWQREREALRSCVESLATLIDCNALHHTPSDRHGPGVPCPAEARLRAKVESALKASVPE